MPRQTDVLGTTLSPCQLRWIGPRFAFSSWFEACAYAPAPILVLHCNTHTCVRACVVLVCEAPISLFFFVSRNHACFFFSISWFNYTNDSRGLNKISSFFRGQRKMKRWRLSRRVLWQNVKSSTNNFLLLNTLSLRISACTYRNFERVYDKHNIYEGCKRNGLCENNVGKEKCKN